MRKELRADSEISDFNVAHVIALCNVAQLRCSAALCVSVITECIIY